MAHFIPRHTIHVKRDGKTVVPDIGKPFDFTDDEVADIRAGRHDALRRPINETPEVTSDEPEATPAAAAPKGRRGKAAAPADDTDEL